MKTVYLAGPISGCTDGEANNWRNYVRGELEPAGIVGVSPLRCEPIHGERYAGPLNHPYIDPRFGTPRAIASKNLFDVQSCTMTLAYLMRANNPDWPSVGTLGELFWAKALGKPTILVSDDPRLTKHPVVDACAGWVLESLDDAIDVIIGVFSVYARRV